MDSQTYNENSKAMMYIMDALPKMYPHLLDSMGFYNEISDQYGITRSIGRIANQKNEFTELYLATANKRTSACKLVYEQDMKKHDDAIMQLVESVEDKIKKLLVGGQYIGFGYRSIDDEKPSMIKKNEWHFLRIDFKNSKAYCEERIYIGVRFMKDGHFQELIKSSEQMLQAELPKKDNTDTYTPNVSSQAIGSESDIDTYQQREDDFLNWLRQDQPDIDETFIMRTTKEAAFNQVKQANPNLWDIEFSYFSRFFWQDFSTKTGIKGQLGRGKNK